MHYTASFDKPPLKGNVLNFVCSCRFQIVVFLVFFCFSCVNKSAVYFSYRSNKNSIRLASLVKGCCLYAKSTALSNSLCAFVKLAGMVKGAYKSANELFGNSALTSNTFCAASSMTFTCLSFGLSGQG